MRYPVQISSGLFGYIGRTFVALAKAHEKGHIARLLMFRGTPSLALWIILRLRGKSRSPGRYAHAVINVVLGVFKAQRPQMVAHTQALAQLGTESTRDCNSG